MPSQDILTLTWSKIVWTGPSHFGPDKKQVWKRKGFGPAQIVFGSPKNNFEPTEGWGIHF